MANIDIKGPEDYKFYIHTSMEGKVWLDGKGKPILLDQPLVNQVDFISPTELWNSRCTRESIHPKDTPPRKGGPTIALQLIQTLPTSTPPQPYNGDYNQYVPIRCVQLWGQNCLRPQG